ncbi:MULTISPECIES: hypothetical protein [unclassified Janthinobacterium]|uniref:hypothetical protein n=1 Tax=unclassified Janthinobacterium TaxID=2610881 RepID=UPI0025B1C33B|nr:MULTISPECIES: hypothetical protein [unclassified Janthinobacterium]MDN2717832.1 hypothetical protein [Janthinobacterium sp. SUN120]MDO8041277.1 hypothetical protein [Janthinobacterium sp. SUN137]
MKNTIQVQEVVEPESGKVHRFYTYNRKPCKRVPIDTRLSRQLAGYALIEKDLRSVGVWLAEIDSLRANEIEIKGHILAKDRKMYNVIKGLFVAALTFYGKCFTRCEGRPVKLERKQVEEKYRLKHDDLLNYRNNFAAHSGAKNLESVGIAVVLPRVKKGETYPQLYRELYQPDLFITKEGGIDFKEVVESMREVVLKKIQLLSDKIMKEEVMPLGLDHWLKK